MALISLPYLLLTAAAALLCRLLPVSCRWTVLLAASAVFLGAQGAPAAAALAAVLACHAAALGIARLRAAGRLRGAKVCTAASAGALCAFMLVFRGRVQGASYLGLILLAYLLDASKGKMRPEKNPLRFAVFACFYPQMTCGPVSRWVALAPQMQKPEASDEGACGRIVWGLFKKLVLADRLAVLVNAVYADPGIWSSGTLWAAVFAYAVQMYADFSGCMDVVLGAARLLGVRLEENFRRPYFARSFSEYWQRWHITMGAWFREYAFYPLALSPALMKRTARLAARGKSAAGRRLVTAFVPLMVTWALTGLWHGAAWHYVLWGALNGALILAESCRAPKRRLPAAVQIGCTFVVMTLTRVLFRAESVGAALAVWRGLFAFRAGAGVLACGLDAADFAAALAAAAALLAADVWAEKRGAMRLPGWARFVLSLAGVCAVLVFGMYGPGYRPAEFFYGRF